jgi:formamidopyrimidine-DNA glycosylase
MPELPEVETVKNQLIPYVTGRTIRSVELLWDGMVKGMPVKEFLKRVSGQKVLEISRRGKYLLLSLKSGDYLVIHLKMTGSLLLGNKKESEIPQYTRAIINLDDGQRIYFRDPRKFGVLKVIDGLHHIENKLGLEPFDAEFTEKYFFDRIKTRKTPIKALLLDQKFLAGVGNMYADEALFTAKIYPARSADSLTKNEAQKLYHATRDVLTAAIGSGGASIVTYFHPDGSKGTAHFQFNVAHAQVKNCRVCGTSIERMVVRGRGTYYCPHCQPAKKYEIKQKVECR